MFMFYKLEQCFFLLSVALELKQTDKQFVIWESMPVSISQSDQGFTVQPEPHHQNPY